MPQPNQALDRTEKEAAAYLSVSLSTVRRWVRKAPDRKTSTSAASFGTVGPRWTNLSSSIQRPVRRRALNAT